MQIVRIEPDVTWSEFVVVRLLRRWVAARRSGANALPSLVQLADELGEPAEAAVALHSLFQLTEDCLGREMSADERATLSLVAAALGRRKRPHRPWPAAAATRTTIPARYPFDRKAPRQAGSSPNFLRQTGSSRS